MAKPKHSLNLAEPSFLSAKFLLSWHAVYYFILWDGLDWLLLAHLI